MIDNFEFMPMLTIRQVALLLDIHTNTIRRWCKRGILSSYSISGGDQKFKLQDIDRLLSELKGKQSSQKEAGLAVN